MSESCNCIDIKVEVMMDEPEINCEVDVSEVILCSDGEDYKRGYEEGHAQGLVDGQADGYQSGYDEGHKVGYDLGYTEGKQDGITEGYNNGYEQGKVDGYKDGYDEGYAKGYSEGYEKGKSECFDVDAYFEQKFNEVTKNGTITSYSGAFGYNSYVDDVTFKPTCDIKPVNALGMFKQCRITNLLKILEDRGVTLDTSQCTNFTEWLAGSTITHIPCVSLLGIGLGKGVGTIFYGANRLVYIKKIITRADLVWNASSFSGVYDLETIEEIEGEFGTSIVLNNATKLKVETVKRILLALTNYAGTENEFVNKITFHVSIWNLLDKEGNTAPNGTTWKDYVTNKGWQY